MLFRLKPVMEKKHSDNASVRLPKGALATALIDAAFIRYTSEAGKSLPVHLTSR